MAEMPSIEEIPRFPWTPFCVSGGMGVAYPHDQSSSQKTSLAGRREPGSEFMVCIWSFLTRRSPCEAEEPSWAEPHSWARHVA